jgi:predicted transcriptional regulator
MKSATVTIRLDRETQKVLNSVCKQSGKSRSEIVRDALKRQLSIVRFEELRKKALPFAEAQGYLTDDDIFREVS